MPPKHTRQAFRGCVAGQPRGRFERAAGQPIAMPRQPWVRARLKARVRQALDRAIRDAGLPCEAAPDGMTDAIDDATDHWPDALIHCSPPIPDDATAAPNPVVIVEVLCPGAAAPGVRGKLADCFCLASVQHDLLVRPLRPETIHHRRTGDRIEATVVRQGAIRLDPPGIGFALESICGAQPAGNPHTPILTRTLGNATSLASGPPRPDHKTPLGDAR